MLKIIFYLIFLVFLFPVKVHAYLDPGAGSYLFQILTAGLLGSLFFAKSIFKKFSDFIKGIFSKKATQNDQKS